VSTAALALSVVRRYLPSPILWPEAEKTNRNWLSRQRPLADRKTYFRSFIYGRSFANNKSINQAFIAGNMVHKNTQKQRRKAHTHTHNYKLLTYTKKVTRPK